MTDPGFASFIPWPLQSVHAIRRLVAVVRADNMALAALRMHAAGVQSGRGSRQAAVEMLCPLRFVLACLPMHPLHGHVMGHARATLHDTPCEQVRFTSTR